MNAYLTIISNYLDELTLREKLLLLAVFFAVVYSLWDIFFFSDHTKHQQQTQAELQKVRSQGQDLAVAIAQIKVTLAKNVDPNKTTKQAIITTTQELEDSQQLLDEKLNKLVSPTKITELLRNLLLQSHGLKLVSLNNEPVYSITLEHEKKSSQQNNNAQTLLYEHATTIKLSGTYLQLHQYLEALENSPWGLFWDQLEYVVKDYPKAEITLRVHTVSTDQHWIGL